MHPYLPKPHLSDQQPAGILSAGKMTLFHTFLRSSVTPHQHSIYVPINDPFY